MLKGLCDGHFCPGQPAVSDPGMTGASREPRRQGNWSEAVRAEGSCFQVWHKRHPNIYWLPEQSDDRHCWFWLTWRPSPIPFVPLSHLGDQYLLSPGTVWEKFRPGICPPQMVAEGSLELPLLSPLHLTCHSQRAACVLQTQQGLSMGLEWGTGAAWRLASSQLSP